MKNGNLSDFIDGLYYGAEAFLDEKLWNGKAFYDVERDITWIDW